MEDGKGRNDKMTNSDTAYYEEIIRNLTDCFAHARSQGYNESMHRIARAIIVMTESSDKAIFSMEYLSKKFNELIPIVFADKLGS